VPFFGTLPDILGNAPKAPMVAGPLPTPSTTVD
jgi:hypothetical protein